MSRTQINHDPDDLCNVITIVMLQVRQTRSRMGRGEILLIPALICTKICTPHHLRQSGPFQILQSQCALCACALLRACSYPVGMTPGCRPGLGCSHLINRNPEYCQSLTQLSTLFFKTDKLNVSLCHALIFIHLYFLPD